MTTETARVEAFSDGVFAIAITLLILEIKVPSSSTSNLASELLRQWPSYLSFFISFAFIGIMWINHHRLFAHIRKSDDLLLIFNLALMFGVTIIPFTTSVLAAHLGHPGARTAMIVYDAAYFGIAVFFNLLCATPPRATDICSPLTWTSPPPTRSRNSTIMAPWRTRSRSLWPGSASLPACSLISCWLSSSPSRRTTPLRLCRCASRLSHKTPAHAG